MNFEELQQYALRNNLVIDIDLSWMKDTLLMEILNELEQSLDEEQ